MIHWSSCSVVAFGTEKGQLTKPAATQRFVWEANVVLVGSPLAMVKPRTASFMRHLSVPYPSVPTCYRVRKLI